MTRGSNLGTVDEGRNWRYYRNQSQYNASITGLQMTRRSLYGLRTGVPTSSPRLYCGMLSDFAYQNIVNHNQSNSAVAVKAQSTYICLSSRCIGVLHRYYGTLGFYTSPD